MYDHATKWLYFGKIHVNVQWIIQLQEEIKFLINHDKETDLKKTSLNSYLIYFMKMHTLCLMYLTFFKCLFKLEFGHIISEKYVSM